jgi:hypothetical protein
MSEIDMWHWFLTGGKVLPPTRMANYNKDIIIVDSYMR